MHPIRSALLAAVLAAPLSVLAQPAPEASARVVASGLAIEAPVLATRVDGWLDVGTDGAVVGYEPLTQLAEPLRGRLKALVSGLRFEPVLEDGRPVIARAHMRLALVASELPDKSLRVGIENVTFPEPGVGADEAARPPTGAPSPRVVRRVAPRYPEENLAMGLSARVLVAVHMAPDGAIRDVAVRQSALLHTRGGPRPAVQKALAAFETAALRSIARWQVQLDDPTAGPLGPDERTGLVAVEFTVNGTPSPRPGLWSWETRSARREPPWMEPTAAGSLAGVGDVTGEDAIASLAPPKLKLLSSLQDAAL